MTEIHSNQPTPEYCGPNCEVWLVLQGTDKICPFVKAEEAQRELDLLSAAMEQVGELVSREPNNFYTSKLVGTALSEGQNILANLLPARDEALIDAANCLVPEGGSAPLTDKVGFRLNLVKSFS